MDPLDALSDIEMLPPPSASGGVMVLLLVSAIAAGLFWYLRKQQHREAAPAEGALHHEAIRRLAALRMQWEEGAIADREAAYQLCALLRIGLGLERLNPDNPPIGLDAEAWREWHGELQRARYPAVGYRLTENLFAMADSWLRHRDTHA